MFLSSIKKNKQRNGGLLLKHNKVRSISRRLTINLMLAVIIVSAGTTLISYVKASREAKRQLDIKADQSLSFLANILKVPLWNFNEETIKTIGMLYAENEFTENLKICDSNGKIILNIEKNNYAPLVSRSAKVMHNGIPVGHIDTSLSLAPYIKANRQLLWSGIFTLFISLLALMVLTGFLLRIFLKRPFDRFSEIVHSYSSDTYDLSVQHMPFVEFQPFVAVLSKAYEELKKHRNQLDDLVAERTEELTTLNELLQEEIREREHAEEALKKAHNELGLRVEERISEFKAVNKELETLVYSVAHDLRAPLRAIDGFSQLLLENYSDALNEQGKHYLKRTRAGTQNMGQLIDDFLNLPRTMRRPMEKKTVDMETIAREAYKSLEHELKGRKVNFTVHKCPPAFADTPLMGSVFQKLLSNALKFTRNQTAAEIEIGCENRDEQTVFFVKDNGVGFDMKYVGKLFAPFQRLHRVEEYGGSGIGLAIVQRIIHRHGGRIWVESEIDVGTTFYFSLPRS